MKRRGKKRIKHVYTDTHRTEHPETRDRLNPSNTCYLHTQKRVSEHFKNHIQNIPHLIKTNIPPNNSKIYIGYKYTWNTYYIDLILGHIKSLNKLKDI